ncbi:MAG: YmdB family metallophosphoesterase, partial [Rhodobacteraceae bacterium]|nr:YmdB family metallophosphoesterase [Paracoccaceae bacterium]
AYMTDVGMSGTYESVIGMRKDSIIDNFVRGTPRGKMDAAVGPATLSGILLDSDDRTGLVNRIRPVRIGGMLGEVAPEGTEDPFAAPAP